MKSAALKSLVILLIASVAQGQSFYEPYTAPVEIEINGNPAEGQVFTVGTAITVTCRIVADAEAYYADDGISTPEAGYRAQAQSSLKLKRGSTELRRDDHNVLNEDAVSAAVVVDEILSVTYTLQIPSQFPGQYKVEANSNAYGLYQNSTGGWVQAAVDAESDLLTFEVIAEQQDTTPPVIDCPVDFTVYVNPGETGTVVDYVVTATDDVSAAGDIVIDCVPPSGSTFPLGASVVNCTATDEAGNIAACTFTITVEEQDVIDFFDAAVANGTLVGVGAVPAVAEFRLDLMRGLLEIADALILDGRVNFARFVLELAYDLTDGQPQPLDLVEGDSAPQLATAIQALIDSLG